MACNRIESPSSRRDFLLSAGAGFGAVALSALTGERALAATSTNPAAAKIPHALGRAKNVIFLFMEGGPSHLDLFDPKPLLQKLAGQRMPDSFERPVTAMGEVNSPLLASKRKWKQHGASGLWISDWLPNHSRIADELCVIRSCVSDGINHAGGVCQMNTGLVFGGRPSLGAWVSYGLGTENESLPGFVVIKDSKAMVVNGARCWGSGFMPASYQGTLLESGDEPISYLNVPKDISLDRQRNKLAFLQGLNRRHQKDRSSNTDLEARIHSYELAARMQAEAPEAIDLTKETKATQNLYGLGQEETKTFGRQCLMARRLVERGVRFVQLYHGAGSKWDSHSGMEKNHSKLCAQVDLPIVGLLTDLKARGLLDETLVIWGGEFGRTPQGEPRDTLGRDHHIETYAMWFCGGGIKGGQTIGETDELGYYAVKDSTPVHDLQATVLHLLGLDHLKLTYRFQGRDFRLTDVAGNVLHRLVS